MSFCNNKRVKDKYGSYKEMRLCESLFYSRVPKHFDVANDISTLPDIKGLLTVDKFCLVERNSDDHPIPGVHPGRLKSLICKLCVR